MAFPMVRIGNQLFKAAREGNLDDFRRIFNELRSEKSEEEVRSLLLSEDDFGDGLLHCAISSRQSDIVKELLEKQWFEEANMNRELRVSWLKTANNEGDKPLKVAQSADSESTELQQMLMNAARKDTLGTVEGDGILKWDSYEAAWSQWLDIIEHPERNFSRCIVNETCQWLLSLKLDKNAPNERKEKAEDIITKIVCGADEGRILEPMCESAPAGPGILHQAARDGNTRLLKCVVQLEDWELLDRLLSMADADKNTVLHQAVESHRLSTLKVLLDPGQQQTEQERDNMILKWLDTRNNNTKTPLDMVLEAGRDGSKMLGELKQYLLNYTRIAFSEDEVNRYNAQRDAVKKAIDEATSKSSGADALAQLTTVEDALQLQYLWSIVTFLRGKELRKTLLTWRQLRRILECAEIMHATLPEPTSSEREGLARELENDINNLLQVKDKINKVVEIVNPKREGYTPMQLLMGPSGNLKMLPDMIELGIECERGEIAQTRRNILHVAADTPDQNILIKLRTYFVEMHKTNSLAHTKADIKRYLTVLKSNLKKISDSNIRSDYLNAATDAQRKIEESVPLEGSGNGLRKMLLQRDTNGETPLHIAARQDCVQHVTTLVNLWKGVLGSDNLDDLLNCKDGKGRVPFLSAAAGGAVKSALFLLQYQDDLCAQDNEGKNALTIAMENDHTLFVKMLLFKTEGESRDLLNYEMRMVTKIQAQENVVDGQSYTETVQTIDQQHLDKIFKSVDKIGLNVVHHAVISQKEGMLRILLQSGAMDCLFEKDSDQERTPYLWAMTTGNLTIVKMIFGKLIKQMRVKFARTDVDKNGNSAGHIAAEFGHRNIIQYLNVKKIPLFMRNKAGKIPVELAIEHGQLDVVKYLVEDCGQLVLCVDVSRALKRATEEGHKHVLQYLLNLKDPAHVVHAVGEKFNLLDTAINGNKADMAMAILSTSKRNQVLTDICGRLTPFQKLLKYMPEVAAQLLNQYISKDDSVDFVVNFSLLEEQRGTISSNRLRLANQDFDLQENSSVAHVKDSILLTLPQDSSVEIFDKDGNKKLADDEQGLTYGFQLLINGQKFHIEPDRHGCRQYLPDFRMKESRRRKKYHPLNLVTDSKTDALIQHPVTMSCIKTHWDSYKKIYWRSIVIMLMHCIHLALNITGQAFKHNGSANGLASDGVLHYTMAVCVLVAVIGIFREILQFLENGLDYFNWGNIVDWASYIMTLLSVTPLPWQYKHLLGAFAVLITSLNTMLYMRALPVFGIFICMLRNTLMTLLWYFPGLLILISIFAVCFQIVMLKLVPFDNYWTSAVSIYVMMTGELDYSDRYLPSEDGDLSLTSAPERHAGMVLLVVVITVMSIIVANLLIGLAVYDVSDLTLNAEKHVLILKGQMILDHLFNIVSRWTRQPGVNPNIMEEGSKLTIPVKHDSNLPKANRFISWCQHKLRHPLTKKSIGEKIHKLLPSSEEVKEKVPESNTILDDILTRLTSIEQNQLQEPSQDPKEPTQDMQLFAPHGGKVFRENKWDQLSHTDSLDSMLTLLYIEYKQNIEFYELVHALHNSKEDAAKELEEVLDMITGSIGSWTAARLLWMERVHPGKRTEELTEEEAIFQRVIRSVLGKITTSADGTSSCVTHKCSRCNENPICQLNAAGVIEAMLMDNIKGMNAYQVDLQSVLNDPKRKVKCKRLVDKGGQKVVCSGTNSYAFQIIDSPMLICVQLGDVKLRNKIRIKLRDLQSSIVLSRPTSDKDKKGRTKKEHFARYDLVMATIFSEQPRRYWSVIKVGDSWWRHDPKLLIQKGCRAMRISRFVEDKIHSEDVKSYINYVVYRKDVASSN